MRITQGMMVNNYLHNLNKNYTNLGKLQMQLSTGHKVSKPSDNPFVVTRTMELKSSIAANERFKKNIEEAKGWVDTQEMALGQINDALQKARELTVQGATGSLSESDKLAVAEQIKQIREQIVDIANTSYDGRYIFSGTNTTTKPFEITEDGKVQYNGSTEELDKELSQGVSLNIGISGKDFFKANYTQKDPNASSTDTEGIFFTLNNIIASLEGKPTNPEGQSTSSLLGVLDNNMENISTIRSDTGAIQNRIEDMYNKNESETFNMTTLLANTYDVDLAETYMQTKVLESIYQASLNVGARVLQPSILDFLR